MFNTKSSASQKLFQTLPNKIHCPVCGEPMIKIALTPDEYSGAVSSGALAATKLSCVCGAEGVLALRRMPDKLYLYSLSFWIVPKKAEKGKTLTKQELRNWLLRMPQPFHA
jgi:transcription elongation factor Elf1